MTAFNQYAAALMESGSISTLGMPEDVWLQLRTLGIGASEAAECIGLSKWRCQSEWVEKKLGLISDTQSDNYRLSMKRKMGHIMEPVTAELFAQATGLKVQNFNYMQRHPQHQWMLCNIDRRIVGLTENQQQWLSALFGYEVSGPGIAELKNVEYAKEWGQPDDVSVTGGLCTSGEVPEDYYLQVQHQLAVTGYTWAFLVVTINGWDVRWYPIQRCEDTIADLIELEEIAWGYVQRREIPPVDLDHPTAVDLLKRRYPGTNGETVLLDAELMPWHQVREDAKRKIAELQAVVKAADAQILEVAKDASVILLPDGTAYTRKVQTRKAFEVKDSSFVVLQHTNNPPKYAKAKDSQEAA